MSNHSSHLFALPRVLVAATLTLFAGLASATAIYDAVAQASLTINAITNQTNPGDLSGLSITGDAYLVNEGSTTVGNAQATYGGTIDLQDSSASNPGWLRQDSEAHGNAEAPPQLSAGTSFHISHGEFNLRNDSATDSFQIDFSLVYSLAVGAGVTNILGENAFSEAYVRLLDDLLQINEDRALIADALGVLGPSIVSDGATILFSIILGPNQFDRLSLDVSAQGSATSVPEPAISYLLGGGMLGLIAVLRRRVAFL